jgi:hypothetical protein
VRRGYSGLLQAITPLVTVVSVEVPVVFASRIYPIVEMIDGIFFLYF